MHGCPGNSVIMKFMCTTLKGMAGSDVEWFYPDGPCSWKPLPGSTDPKSMEPSDFAKRIAGKKAFTAWYDHSLDSSPEDLDRLYPNWRETPRKDTGDLEGI